MTAWAGFAMLAAVAALMLATGLPAFMAMIGVASAFAIAGVAAGAIPLALLGALPARVIGLLETDLLQALPLYVLIGGLLNRLPLADLVFRGFTRLGGLSPAAAEMAGLGVGALLAPMNGSVGASVAMLSRVVAPRLRTAGVAPGQSLATICAAGTLGVVVPPSLVLILFGDAMMRAHTEALNTTRAMTRVVNTQDVFRGAMLPGALLLALNLGMVWWRGRQRPIPAGSAALRPGEWAMAALTVLGILTLLGAVTLGLIYAVEAAACGAMILAFAGIGGGAIRGEALRALLHDTMAMTGALFALFLAAVTFTLVFRAFGSDRLLADWVTRMPGGAFGALGLVLGLIALSALVLDAFEMVLVIVPLLMPPLLTRAPDVVWDSVIVLLVLQGSFLLPPFGYAVMTARGLTRERLPLRQVVRAVMPFLTVQLLVLGLVIAIPKLVHLTSPDDTAIRPTYSDAEARQRLLRMTLPEPEGE